VASLEGIATPAAVAKAVMDYTDHIMLVGEGAKKFALRMGFKEENLLTEQSRKDYLRWKATLNPNDAWLNPPPANRPPGGDDAPSYAGRHVWYDEKGVAYSYGTINMNAVNASGDISSCTTTSGLSWKIPGRIGDSPVIGAGTYANARCGVSGTGWGEYYIRNVVAYDICARVEYAGASIAAAASEVILTRLPKQEKDTGGVIAMDREGHIATPFNTSGMYRGWVDQTGAVRIAIFVE